MSRAKGNGCSRTTGGPAPRVLVADRPWSSGSALRSSKLLARCPLSPGSPARAASAGRARPDLERPRDQRLGGRGAARVVVVVERAERRRRARPASHLGREHDGGAGAMRSSLRRRPAPSSVAARPSAPASARSPRRRGTRGSTGWWRARGRRVGIVDDARVAALQADAEREPLQPGAAGDRALDAARRRRADRAPCGRGPASRRRAARSARARRRARRRGARRSPRAPRRRCRSRRRAAGPCPTAPRGPRRPSRPPRPMSVRASVRARLCAGRNAPLPTLTSMTSASVPSAIFFERIEEAMSGIDSTVAVASRSA